MNDAVSNMEREPGVIGTPRLPALVEVIDVRRHFYGVQVLQGVNLSFATGCITGLIGPNGAGKSTLLNVVSGLYPANSGQVRFDGRSIGSFSPSARVHLGLVRTFQLARGFPKLTVFQHLMLYGKAQPGESLFDLTFRPGLAHRREKELEERAFFIAQRLRLLPVIDNPVVALSGGQKKLIEIGRALMAEPKMILMDEPMAGVNPALADEISEHLVALNGEGTTICIVEHDMNAIKRLCHRVICMAEGRTLMSGTFSEVVNDPRVQESYLGHRQ